MTLDGRASYVFFADERLAPGRDPATHSLGLSLGLRWVFLRGVTFVPRRHDGARPPPRRRWRGVVAMRALAVVVLALALALVGAAGAQAGSPSVIYPPRAERLRFSHAAHAARGVARDFCHGRAATSRKATDDLLPSEEVCATCHRIDRKGAAGDGQPCATCHAGAPGPRLGETPPQLRFDHRAHADRRIPLRALPPRRRARRRAPRRGAAVDGHLPPVPRRAARPLVCERALRDLPPHAPRRYARDLAADARSGVAPAFPPLGTRRFHPDGWSDARAAANPAHHAWQAQRALRTCASCHREESCMECHAAPSSTGGAAGKMQVSPHPPDWAESGRCRALASRNPRVCLRCHGADDPLVDRCR